MVLVVWLSEVYVLMCRGSEQRMEPLDFCLKEASFKKNLISLDSDPLRPRRFKVLGSDLFNIELVRVRVDVGMEDGGVEDYGGTIPVGIVLRQVDTKPRRDTYLVVSLGNAKAIWFSSRIQATSSRRNSNH